MLDIKFIRENSGEVKRAIINKGLEETVDVDSVLELDDKRRELIQKLDSLKQQQNQITEKIKQKSSDNKQQLVEEATKLKEKIQKLENEFKKAVEEFQNKLLLVPNITSPNMHVGKDETDNKVTRTWGDKTKFKFKPKDHVELGISLDIIDVKKSAEISGSRFCFLKNEAVLLQFAILQFVFNTLTSQSTLESIIKENSLKVSSKPFVPMLPPVIMKKEIMKKMDRMDPEDDRYVIDKDNISFVGSAEHTVGPYHMNEAFKEEELPIRYIAYSTAFRRESGSHGKDVRGILRVHQFDKMEMETFTTEETGQQEQDFILAIQEYLVQKLELPYQVVQICTGDTGKPNYNQLDIEVWIPSQEKYRETHTSDYMTDYQARRLNTKYVTKDGKKKFVHMNDATAFAMGRIILAIIENYQQKDGSVVVPEVLRAYVGKDVITSDVIPAKAGI